jgi:hypothetical protein
MQKVIPLDLAIAKIPGPYWNALVERKGKSPIDLDN